MEHSDYILSKINKAMVSNIPYPHFIIHDFLPDGLYNRLVEANSKLTNDNLEAISKIEIADVGEFKPTVENISEASTITYNMYKADDVHKEIDLILSSVEVKEAIFNKLNIVDNNSTGGSELMRDIDIRLSEHTDDHMSVLTHFQLYCPIDESHSHLGVKLLSENFKTVKQVPYIPNVVWCIAPSDNTWHKVDLIENLTDYNRDSITMRYIV
jgi:hypothetical protein